MSIDVERRGPRVATRPYPIKRAILFVGETHRRLPRVTGGMWALAATVDDRIVGVAIVGPPFARMSDDGLNLEVVRVATDGTANACSALYGACARAARAMGAADLWTTIHADEGGHSLRASGWVDLGICGGGEWSRPSRPRVAAVDPAPKRLFAVAWGLRAHVARPPTSTSGASP